MQTWFSSGLISWYKANKRDLPWRNETDAYKIWLSEIILQQTQVAQGLNYYLRFVQAFDTVQKLADAPEDDVLKLWEGLGYYSRARNMHSSAKFIVKQYDSIFPDQYSRIRMLKGVGDYTAAAVSSFAFNLPHAVVDGNVYRVLSRIFGISSAIDSIEGKKKFKELANSLLDQRRPALHNQSIMEFGALFCRPVQPLCSECIFNSKCYAHKNKQVAILPVKGKKVVVRTRYLNYFVRIDKKGNIPVKKRINSDIWKGLYEFDLVESTDEVKPEKSHELAGSAGLLTASSEIVHASKQYKHQLTHQLIFARFYVLVCKRALVNKRTMVKHYSEIRSLAFPRLIEKFLNDCDLKEIL